MSCYILHCSSPDGTQFKSHYCDFTLFSQINFCLLFLWVDRFSVIQCFFVSLIWHLKANLYLLTNLFWKYYYGNVETIVKLSLNFISYKNEFFCNYFLKDRRFQQKLYVAYVICFIFTKVFNVIRVQFYKLLFLFSFF